ncbi:MAG: sugar ABC transporter substrate-binding protein [Actinomycetota bacterium]|nr:sugar ABC transporter substrate-binding protein [Actinomycetota bacterium]
MRKLIVLFIGLIIIFTFVGCKAKDVAETTEAQTTVAVSETTIETKTAKTWKIGFNNYGDSHEFCAKVSAGIREEAKKAGVELEYTEAMMDGAKMIANTQTLIDKGCDLIIDFNWIPEVGVTMLKMCNDAGVKLISMDTVYEGTYYFGANSYKAGQVLGEYMSGLIKEKWNGKIDAFVGLYYLAGGDIVMDRVKGCEDYLKDAEGIEFPSDDMNFLFDAGSSDQTVNCKQKATDFLTAHPDLKHIVFVTHNDESGAGVFAGIEASAREADCLLGSTGGDTPFQDHIRAGGGDVWVASSAFAPEKYGAQVIPMAIDILEGKDVPMEVYLEHFVINKDNLDEYYPQ